eukprot:Seg1658.1 transcript_id=Seg1658.1/GoldUCD/mRNA.D3Y31 product="Glutathione S-transferase 1 isoform D" protein_id=Seg1658.1/GoldUCD/D3Y31
MILYASMTAVDIKAIRFYIEMYNVGCCFYDIDTGNKEVTKANLARKNPSGIVPFLEDSGVKIAGTAPVLLYLAEKYADFAMFGKSFESRTKVESLIFWAATSLARSVYNDFAAPRLYENHSIGEYENVSLISHAKGEIMEHFDTLENIYLCKPGNMYLVSNELTMADIYIASTMSPLESVFFDFSPWPRLCKWFEGIKMEITKKSQMNRLTKLLRDPHIFPKWAYFREKAKAIALPFDQKSVFPKWAYFREKEKAIALLFDQKSIFSKWAYFREKAKAIALLFDKKSMFSKWAYFCEKAKAIALLFDQKPMFSKWAYFREKAKAIALLSDQKISIFQMGLFSRKSKGYSLTV